MTKETFLPEGYTVNQGGGKYLKPDLWEQKIRILWNSLLWWVDWDRSWEKPDPVFTREKKAQINEWKDNRPKEFWKFPAWDYKAKVIGIYTITQNTIKEAIVSLYNNPEWGDPKEYDLNIVGTGDWLARKYNVQPSPKKELTEEQKNELDKVEINMELLFENWEPITEINSESTPF